jgi:hypothetical protein
MKTAILIVGNLRTWDKCKENFKQVFNHINSDVFVSTYDIQYNYHPAQMRWMGGDSDVYLTDDEIKSKFYDINVKGFNIESYNDILSLFKTETLMSIDDKFKDDLHSYLQYKKIKNAFNIMNEYELNNKFKYDMVLKIRSDIHHNTINFEMNVDNSIIISNGNVYPNDVFFSCSRNNFESIIDFIMKEFHNPIYENSHIQPPHTLLLNAIKHFNIDIKTYDIMNHVVRKTGIQYY